MPTTDLYEGGYRSAMLWRGAAIVAAGIDLIILLALSDNGRPPADGAREGRLQF